MGDSNLTAAHTGTDILRLLASNILDRPAFGLLSIVYQLFFNVASATLFSGATIMNFFSRVQLILGVFTMFQLAMSILKGIVNPDNFFGKDKGVKSIISRIVIALIMLTLITPISIPAAKNEYEKQINNNGILFGTLYSLQHRLLSNNTIGRLILGTTDTSPSYISSDSDDELKTSSRIFTSTVLKAFYRINLIDYDSRKHEAGKDDAVFNENRVCQDIDDDVLASYTRLDADPGEIIDMATVTCNSDGGFIKSVIRLFKKLTGSEYYVFAYTPILGAIVAFIFSFILLSFTVDVAVRAVKLSVLRLIAPIPIISYMNPNGSKDNAFNSWVKMLTTTYLDLFVRLAVVYFVIFLIQDMIANGLSIKTLNGQAGIFSLIIIWIGLFIFAKQAPKFFKDVLGLKNEPGNTIGKILGFGAAGVGVIGSARTGWRAASEENAKLHTTEKDKYLNYGRNFGSAVASAIGGGIAGGKALMGKDPSIKSVIAAQSQRNATRAAHSTLPGRVADSVYGLATGRSLATRDQSILDANKAAASSIGKFKSTAVAEAMKKGSYGTVSSGKDRFGKLSGIKFNKGQLEAAMAAKNERGEFKYTDIDGHEHSLNVAWFDSGVMGDIEDTQTARYLASDWDSSRKAFSNGKINVDWRQAAYDMSQAEISFAGDFLGQNTYDPTTNTLVGSDRYGDIGKTIGTANDAATEMATDMKRVMHRANKQGKN